jgi:hypothetical protein
MNADESRGIHGAHEDERNRSGREKRATAQAIADERLLAGRRLDALLPYSLGTVDALEDDTGFAPGCYL